MNPSSKPVKESADRKKPDPKAVDEDKVPASFDEYFQAMNEVQHDLMYVGFSSVKFREACKEKKVSSITVVKVISAYTQVGNNVRNCLDKRRAKIRPDIADMIKNVGERPSRFAIAFLPVTLMVRRNARKAGFLATRFGNIGTDPVLQDPAFTGWKGEQIREFLLAFDKALALTGSAQQHGPDQVQRWIEISRSGYLADSELVAAMDKADNDQQVLAWLRRTLGEG